MLFAYPPIVLIYLIPIVLISLTFHEFSHAIVSYRLGDPTAKNQGRLTLNPFRHIDILGALMFLIARFGWAKPVPINPLYYKDRKKGTMLVSLAGPLSNLLLALVFALPMFFLEERYGIRSGSFFSSFNSISLLYNFSFLFYFINIGLAVFNILPVPPLDGSKILSGILPSRQYFKLLEYQNYFTVGFLIIVFAFPRLLGVILSPFMWAVETAISFIAKSIVSLFI